MIPGLPTRAAMLASSYIPHAFKLPAIEWAMRAPLTGPRHILGPMPQITTPDSSITLEYETAGSPDDPPLLLVPGFGAQLITWPRAFCERLAAGGRFVISYDNRDCGLSSKLDGRLVDVDASQRRGCLPGISLGHARWRRTR